MPTLKQIGLDPSVIQRLATIGHDPADDNNNNNARNDVGNDGIGSSRKRHRGNGNEDGDGDSSEPFLPHPSRSPHPTLSPHSNQSPNFATSPYPPYSTFSSQLKKQSQTGKKNEKNESKEKSGKDETLASIFTPAALLARDPVLLAKQLSAVSAVVTASTHPQPNQQTTRQSTQQSTQTSSQNASQGAVKQYSQHSQISQYSVANIKNIKAAIADSLIMDDTTGHGGSAAEKIVQVSKLCMNHNNKNDRNTQKNQIANNERSEGGEGRPKAMILGAITALDFCVHALAVKNLSHYNANGTTSTSDDASTMLGNENYSESISTGSHSLDQLLAPNSSYSSFGQGWTLPNPFQLPTNPSYNRQSIGEQPGVQSGVQLGVQHGMVTEFTGPSSSGKTQLALSIAARALIHHNFKIHCLISGGAGGCSRYSVSRRLYTLCVGLIQERELRNVQEVRNVRDDTDGRDGGNAINGKELEHKAKRMAAKAMENVWVSTVHDGYSLLASLAKITQEEEMIHTSSVNYTNDSNNTNNTGNAYDTSAGDNGTLLVVDSISGILGHEFVGESFSLDAALANQVGLTLRSMAQTWDGRLDNVDSMDNRENDSRLPRLPPRRFSIVVTNGTIANHPPENDVITSTDKVDNAGNSSNPNNIGFDYTDKPAMGTHWQVSDVGLWLEEDGYYHDHHYYRDQHGDDGGKSTNMFDKKNLVNYHKRVMRATLTNHYGKSCRGDEGEAHCGVFGGGCGVGRGGVGRSFGQGNSFAHFQIDQFGVGDLKNESGDFI